LGKVIWLLSEEEVEGVKPTTDAKSVSILINRLETLVSRAPSRDIRQAIKEWCSIAKDAYVCRNAVVHGQRISYTENEHTFITNTGYHGELRGRKSRSFLATKNNCKMLAEVFGLLDHVILMV